MGKGILFIIIGSFMTMMIVSNTFVKTVHSGSDNSIGYYEDIHTRNMGNTMVNMLLSRLADSLEYRQNSWEEMDFFGGKVEFKVIDSVLANTFKVLSADKKTYVTVTNVDTVIKIHVNVEYNGYEKSITTFTKQNRAGGWVPPVVRAAWTANGPLNNTISDMYIDGRNHDTDLKIIPKTGLPAVSTSVKFENKENAAIGGTFNGKDYPMKYPEDPAVIEENYKWGGTFPETPDEILGYPEGTLKKLAKSGEMGSQYLLNPDEDIENDLNFPLRGVTFIELTDGKERQLVMDGTDGKQNGGMLIIHGPGTVAKIKGLKMDDGTKKKKVKDGDPVIFCHDPGGPDQITLSTDNTDSLDAHLGHGDQLDDCPEITDAKFTGLIVTDYSFHHHLDILGAVLQLSPDLEEDKNCNGNKDHWVYYSEEAIRNATEVTAILSREIGNSNVRVFDVPGYGPGRQKATYYYE